MAKEYIVTIKPKHGWQGIHLGELWHYRELFYIFTWRDLKVRYKQTLIGVSWALIQPFVMMVVFSIFFGDLAKIPTNGPPYPIFVFSGLLFWNYFSGAVTNASNAMISNESIIKKIYFPRIILPLSQTFIALVDFAVAFLILIGLMFYYHAFPSLVGILLLPVQILITFFAATGMGFFLSAVNVRYRDVKYALPFFIQSLLFLTPVIYPTTLIPQRYQWLLSLNPMTGVVDTARAGLLGDTAVHYSLLGVAAFVSTAVFLAGMFYFRKTENTFADIA